MPTFKINTLGCKVNQSESDEIAKQLQADAWDPATNGEPSAMVIINTCTVTHKAAMQSRQAVRQAIRANPHARIIVTGCYAQTEPDALAKIGGVQYVIGNADKHRLVELITADCAQTANGTITICNDVGQYRLLKPAPEAISGRRTRPVLKIQDGCNAACTYCIVPRARGPGRSLPPDDVIAAVRAMTEAGYLEIVLSGIHLGHYGHDLTPGINLAELLTRIEQSTAVPRLRLSSLEPLEVSEDLIERMTASQRLCRHFHIPLQSGDDRILKKMRRPYTSDEFKQLIYRIHERIPDAAIGVDILVGFPGETDTAYNKTYECIRRLPVTYLHVFPFSARPGTPAAGYANRVPPDVIKARCEHMRRLGNMKRMRFHQNFIGRRIPILVETTRHAASGFLKGISSNYLTVLIDTDDSVRNQIISVRITRQVENKLLGIIE
ncbi:MAG: tRNA (N(6)-L-threonylcarbamoyladenosine(37)-C(2))-methylthiotransferase MtaB [Desulfobacterales bacterium]|jgi:threonylcarbamoyladenosine tRNA methylthiotransferase MtaB